MSRLPSQSGTAEDVLQHEPCPGRYLLVGENLGAQGQHLINAAEVQVLNQKHDVFRVAAPGGEDLHRQQVFWRCL